MHRLAPEHDVAAALLVDAGAVLASSLDLPTTMDQVARLTVPRLADLCVIDLRDEDGSIREVAVAAANPAVAGTLETLRMRHPLDPAGQHPVARVIRSGEPELLAAMHDALLRSFAQGSEHARFMIEQGYHSAVVAPLQARGRTLGALSALRLRDGDSYGDADLELVAELARRAALAIDKARLFSQLRRVEQRLEAILVNLAEAVTMCDERGCTVFANQAAGELLGAAPPGVSAGGRPSKSGASFRLSDEHGRELGLERLPGEAFFRGEPAEPLLIRQSFPESGQERWLVLRSSPVREPDGGRVLYAVNVFEDITELKRAQLAESFMAEASRVLASSMDYGETLQRVARLAVPQIADWCAVDLLNEAGELERVAVQQSEAARLPLADGPEDRASPALAEVLGVRDVIRSARPRIHSELDPDAIAALPCDGEQAQMLGAIGATAAIVVPLAAPARTIGAVTLLSAGSSRRLSANDLALAERLGRRAGTAVESARLYTERTRIANVLGAALLPETLPEIPGIAIEAAYRAAGELNDVGGDFYDVFAYGADRWLLAIGDVCGKGPRAASVTALARHTLRAAAILGQTPAGMLSTLHEALRHQPAGADMCTVCLVAVESPARAAVSSSTRRQSARLTVALAGHPPPLLIDEHGAPRSLGRPGTLLGVLDPLDISEVHAEARSGETLLLYTDGLPEGGRSGLALGEQRLAELCAEAPVLTLGELLGRIEQAAVQRARGTLRDDIALLALRVKPEAPPDLG